MWTRVERGPGGNESFLERQERETLRLCGVGEGERDARTQRRLVARRMGCARSDDEL